METTQAQAIQITVTSAADGQTYTHYFKPGSDVKWLVKCLRSSHRALYPSGTTFKATLVYNAEFAQKEDCWPVGTFGAAELVKL